MMINQYAGWDSLSAEVKSLSAEYRIAILAQPKAGYLRISAPFSAPPDLIQALEQIEQRSCEICQFCGRFGATEQQFQEWIYTLCPGSTWVHLLGGGIAASCAL